MLQLSQRDPVSAHLDLQPKFFTARQEQKTDKGDPACLSSMPCASGVAGGEGGQCCSTDEVPASYPFLSPRDYLVCACSGGSQGGLCK